ncbi:MAG: hypothetical protein AB8B56_14325, partial [Crocinitomicaceae bacterium]
MKLLSALCLLIAFGGYCQEDFRLRPWSNCNDYDKQNQIVISEEGKVISFPQYLNMKELTNSQEEKIDGKKVKFITSMKSDLICFVDKDGNSLDRDKFNLRYYNRLKAYLKKLAGLNKLKYGEKGFEDKEEINKALSAIGLNLKDYSNSAQCI